MGAWIGGTRTREKDKRGETGRRTEKGREIEEIERE
jgi:hypothetical protein